MIQVANDIYLTPLWTSEVCAGIIQQAEEHGDFSPAAPRDNFRTQDVVLTDTDNPMLARLGIQIQEGILGFEQTVRDLWWITRMINLRYYDFIVKYTLGIQESLPIHSDESDITFSVKLNDDYEGCELFFPRQDYTNTEVPVGHALVFPGGITHPHEARPLKSGIKYILNSWCSVA